MFKFKTVKISDALPVKNNPLETTLRIHILPPLFDEMTSVRVIFHTNIGSAEDPCPAISR